MLILEHETAVDFLNYDERRRALKRWARHLLENIAEARCAG